MFKFLHIQKHPICLEGNASNQDTEFATPQTIYASSIFAEDCIVVPKAPKDAADAHSNGYGYVTAEFNDVR